MDRSGAVELSRLRDRMDPHSWDLLQRNKGKVRGYVPEYDLHDKQIRLVHHSEAPLAGVGRDKRPNPRVFRDIEAKVDWELPPIVRREARQRYDELVQRLVNDAKQVKAVLGRYEMPASIRRQVEHVAWVRGDPGLVRRIENAEPEAIKVYAGFLMREAANKQKEKDQKKVALDHHGHYNA